MTDVPFNEVAERYVLGAVLSAASVDCGAGWRILIRAQATGLAAADFYLLSHGALYGTLIYLAKRGSALDPVSVGQALETLARERLGKIGPWVESSLDWPDAVRGRLEQLAIEAVTFSNVESHAQIVRKLAVQRRRQEAVKA